MISNITEQIHQQIAQKYNLPEELVHKIDMFQWKMARDAALKYPLFEITGMGRFQARKNGIRLSIAQMEKVAKKCDEKLKKAKEGTDKHKILSEERCSIEKKLEHLKYLQQITSEKTS